MGSKVAVVNFKLPGLPEKESFQITFWGSVAVAFVVCVMGYEQVKLQAANEEGGEGERDDGGEGEGDEDSEWLAMVKREFVKFLASSLYFPIMQTFFSVFSCTYKDPPTAHKTWGDLSNKTVPFLDADPELKCWEGEQVVLAICGVVGILLYYPLSTLLYPRFQWNDEQADIKYAPTWVMVMLQMKLFLAAATTFFSRSPAIYLYTAMFWYAVMTFYTSTTQPCPIPQINIWRTASFVTGFLAQAAAVGAVWEIKYYGSAPYASGLVWLGMPVTFAYFGCYHIRHYPFFNCRKAAEVVPEDQVPNQLEVPPS